MKPDFGIFANSEEEPKLMRQYERAKIEAEINKAKAKLARLELRVKIGFLNHHQMHYVETNMRRAKKRIERLTKKLSKEHQSRE